MKSRSLERESESEENSEHTHIHTYSNSRASQVVPVVKSLPASVEDTRGAAQSLGGEDPLEEGLATHSSILAGRIPWKGELGGEQSIESQRVGQD